MGKGKYQLRKAAGLYWLLDMEQEGVPYKRPIPMNETGAFIWKGISRGESAEQLGAALGREYGIPEDEAVQDVKTFLKQLEIQGADL